MLAIAKQCPMLMLIKRLEVGTIEFGSASFTVGITILEVYGMSENTGPMTVSTQSMPHSFKVGSAGIAIATIAEAEMLLRIAEYLGAEEKTARQVRGALIYPAFMFGTGAVVVLFMMIFILPRFAKIYEMRSASLPAPTRALMGLGNFMTNRIKFLQIMLINSRNSHGGDFNLVSLRLYHQSS